MEISAYRQSFAAYNQAIELAKFQIRAGLRTEMPVDEIIDQYSGLFTLESIEALSEAFATTNTDFEAERTGLRYLCGAARLGYLKYHVRALINEQGVCEAATKIAWDGESLPAYCAPWLIANESNVARRKDLLARYADACGQCDDIRAGVLDSYHESAVKLGFENYRALFADIMQINPGELVAQADSFVMQTDAVYSDALYRELRKNEIGAGPGDVSHADFLYLQRMRINDRYFPRDGIMKMYDSAMHGLGIYIGRQQNIRIDLSDTADKKPGAGCFRINAPLDVRVSASSVGGVRDYTVFFHEAGHAQHFAWSSEGLVDHYPEFLFAPENTTAEGFAFLFSNLFHDPSWLVEYGSGLRPEEAQSISKSLAFITLASIRHYCASLKYEVALHDSQDVRYGELPGLYADLQKQATIFGRPAGMYLADVDDGYLAATYLRGCAFEAGLREHLLTRYGKRWWASRKARDVLIDLWNTSSRYTVDELAGLVGFGPLSFDLLAEKLTEAVKGD